MRVIKQRLRRRFPVVKCGLVALRYIATSIVALLLVLLIFALES
jgi:hypothetical protein